MTGREREVAGLRCSELLERLSLFLDGELTRDEERAVRAHVAGCDLCETFGAGMAALLRELGERLGDPEPVDDAVAARLRARLEAR